MIDNKDAMQLSEYCFDVCNVLNTTIRGKAVSDLGGSARKALEDLERCVS